MPKKQIDVYEIGKKYDYKRFLIEPVKLEHNVPNCGYKLDFNGERAIYCTDMNNLDDVVAENFNLYLIEANFSEKEIQERINAKLEQGIYPYELDAVHNHMSREKCDDWLINNLGKNSKYIYMHQHKERGKKNDIHGKDNQEQQE